MSDRIDHHPDPRNNQEKPKSFLPATLTIVAAILALCTGMVYAVLIGDWRWGVSSVIVFGSLIMVGGALQAHHNRRK